MRIVVFGAGKFGQMYLGGGHNKEDEVVAVCDNNYKSFKAPIHGYKVISPKELGGINFDRVIITINHTMPKGRKNIREIVQQLKSMGINEHKIVLMSFVDDCEHVGARPPRLQFLYDLAKHLNENGVYGAVAELGVFWGNFAANINTAFPNRKLYLFDSFSNFPESDLAYEDNVVKDHLLYTDQHRLATLEDADYYVHLKMPHRKNVFIRKGYVPGTLHDMPEEKFAYVHLDMDTYAPTIAGLEYFGSRMSEGGVIAVHDYGAGNGFYTGCRKAVSEFLAINANKTVPIGDGTTLLILF